MNTRILTFLALLLTSVCGASSACAEALTTMDSVEHVASKHTLVNLNAANVEQLMAFRNDHAKQNCRRTTGCLKQIQMDFFCFLQRFELVSCAHVQIVSNAICSRNIPLPLS